MCIEMDSELHYRVVEGGPEPLVFAPLVDIDKLEDPSIIVSSDGIRFSSGQKNMQENIEVAQVGYEALL